jgi:hypothetical protein
MKKLNIQLAVAVLLICLLPTAFSSLRVIEPEALKTWVASEGREQYLLKYSEADFGYIPYGKTLLGHVELADPEDACSPLTNSRDNDLDRHPIILAKRGGCHFTQKARYAQLAGAKMFLVFDNKADEYLPDLTIADDGQGEEIQIPVLMIANKFGLKMEEFLSDGTRIVMGARFDPPTQNDTVDYEIWIANSNNHSIEFLKEMKPYQDKLEGLAYATPHYSIFTSKLENDPNCMCAGKYCALDPDGDGPLTGMDTLIEDLLQMVIYDEWGQAIWWDYMTSLDPVCTGTMEIHNCGIEARAALGIDEYELGKRFNDSFIDDNADNTLLKREQKLFALRGHLSFPGVVINNMRYRGNVIPASHVFEAVCDGFFNPPDICKQHLASIRRYRKRSVKYIVIVCVVGIAVVAFFLFFCYRRYLKRQIARELSLKANTAVSEYFAMHEAGEKDTKRLI